VAPRYLSPAAVLFIHDRILANFGGSTGLRDVEALRSAAERPKARYAGQELYPALPDKAAALLESICGNHPFVDGNKRTAFVAAGLFLQANGWRLEAETDDAVAFMMDVAAGKIRKEEIRIWIEAHAVPYGASG
jgi:death-on-curing protein